MAKLTASQVRQLLAAYTKQQTDAANAAIAAYDAQVDGDTQQVAATLAAQTEDIRTQTKQTVDKAAIAALLEKRQVEARLADLGLTVAGARRRAEDADGAYRRTTATAKQSETAALSKISEQLRAAKTQASLKKSKNAPIPLLFWALPALWDRK